MLKHGTGLLLSLGRQDTITSVLIDLTPYQGVNLQLKVGDGMRRARLHGSGDGR